ADIIRTLALELGRVPGVLEKDVWVCWALDALFAMPDAPPMAFKGGTSLSKVFDAIRRFSEDIDITIDYRHFCTDNFDPFNATKTARDNFRDQVKQSLRDYIHDVVTPHFVHVWSDQFDQQTPSVE